MSQSAFNRVIAAISTLRELDTATTEPLSAEQIAALSDFPGWGPVAPVFDDQPPPAWIERAGQFTDSAQGVSLEQSRRTVDTSFYTPLPLIELMWRVLTNASFTGGRVLDIGCGTGRFLDGAPTGIPVDYTGVDADPVAAQIARLLHPQATIITGKAEHTQLGIGYDAAIGNVPFSSAAVTDYATYESRPLHVLCMKRALRAVRPGGYVVMVTSRYLMDGGIDSRDALARHADLVSAVRLPARYFGQEGTDVVADVLIMQVRDPATPGPGSGWPSDSHHIVRTDTVHGAASVAVSDYWAKYPDFVAGTLAATGYEPSPLTVRSEDRQQSVNQSFSVATMDLPRCVAPVSGGDFSDVLLTDAQGRPEGSFHVIDGSIFRVKDAALQSVAKPTAELRALIGLRESALTLLDAEADWDTPDDALAPLRQRTRDRYDAYAATFGPLNRGTLTQGKPDPETGEPRLGWRTPTMGGFRRDPSFPRLLALEVFDRSSDEATPAPILLHRVNKRPQRIETVDTPGEALAVAVGETRSVDLPRIAGLLGLESPQDAYTALGDLVYRDPADGGVVPARDYLSGKVRRKLEVAQLAAATDPDEYSRNVEALTSIQPAWLTPADIRIELGSPLLRTLDIKAFCENTLGVSHVSVSYERGVARWTVETHSVGQSAQTTWGTPCKTPVQLLECGLNGKLPTVYDEFYDPEVRKYRKVRNREATEAAVEALSAISARFSTWVWQDVHRSTRLTRDYNERFNSFVPRIPNGDHLPFPRLAEGVTLWPWQTGWVDHALSRGSAFAGHEVGLGKTLSALGLAMSLREFGLANKPMIAVPNHLIEQIAAEAFRAFPTGKFLIVTREDLTRDTRRLFAARCATTNWDCVIVTHEGFASIPMPGRVEKEWLEQQVSRLEDFKRAAGRNAKATARAIRSLEGRLDKLRKQFNDPETITFDQLGIDHISIDEADKFRRLFVPTNSDGFSMGASKRATDLFLKVWHLRNRNPHRPHLAMYSGTPHVNSLCESFVWLMYCAPQVLEDSGLEAFDAWAAQFIRYETIIEVAPDGSGFQSRRRPSVIQNLPELRAMLGSFMHTVRADDVGIERPQARHHTVTAEPAAVAARYMQTLVKRADDLRQGRVTDRRADNMLSVCGDGRKLGLDVSLLGLTETGGTTNKLVKAADNIARIYHENKDRTYPNSPTLGSFQFVACDLGTPNGTTTQTYGRVRRMLIDRGVPVSLIRFAHDATTPKAREALFSSCRTGDTAVLFGSTAKVGYGTNFQARLLAIHHLDVPWTAAGWEQRNGRALRYGNLHTSVDIFVYVTTRTFDAFMSGIVERKARGFGHLYSNDPHIREIDDVGDSVLTFAEVKAAASGNNLLLRQHQLRSAIRKLDIVRATAFQNAQLAWEDAESATIRADALTKEVAAMRAISGHIESMTQTDWDFRHGVRRARTAGRREAYGYSPERVSHRIADTGLHLVCHLDDQFGRFDLVIGVGKSRHRTRELGRIDVPGKVAKASYATTAQWLTFAIREWIGGCDQLATDRSEAIEAWRARADASTQAAEQVVFDQQSDLDALRTELAVVDAEIADTVDAAPAAA